VILKPQPEQVNRISLIGALSVYDLCESVGMQNIGIKWPNDVQINGKKVAGILPEAAWDKGQLRGVVLGIGVNVRVAFEGELSKTGTSIEMEVNACFNRVDLIAALLGRIHHWMALIERDELFQMWQSRLTTLGQQVQVDDVIGHAQGVDDSGALLVKVADGSIKRVMAGDVSLLPPQAEG
jgi:BirA family biotin operon repressor/biotin-[acetyl-CoA-carboxylase] ligase